MYRALRIASLALVVVLAASASSGCCGLLDQDQPSPPVQREEPAVWPLTGEEAGEGANLSARVLSVKVENSRASRPQSGLAEADIVYELLAEGGITRFHAIFHSSVPERVGPVRSARPPDIRLVQQYGSVLVYSGANRIVVAAIDQSGVDHLDETAAGEALERVPERRRPHNLYANLPAARDVAASAGFAEGAEVPALAFGEPSAEASEAPVAAVPINQANDVVWRWDEGTERYARELNGEPHADEGGEVYSAANVVLLFVEEIPGGRPGTDDFRLDAAGDALLFRDGRRYEATWEATGDSPPRFTAVDGSELPFAVGSTWIEVIPAEQRERFEQ